MTKNLPATIGDTLPALTGIAPVLTTTSEVTCWTVTLGPVKADVRYQHGEDDIDWSTVYVDEDLAKLVDPKYAALAAAEENLGEDRWLDRGVDERVDALYDELNGSLAEVKTAIVRAVLTCNPSRASGSRGVAIYSPATVDCGVATSFPTNRRPR